MIVAHLGPPTGRRGGPAGYLAQLQGALAGHGSGSHRVLLPSGGGNGAASPATAPDPALVAIRRLRRTWLGAPAFDRPSDADLRCEGGPVHQSIEATWLEIRRDIGPALEAGLSAPADVLFAHDAPSAEAALSRRGRGQQVWLLMHSPMPLALYLAWSFGVPDREWQEVAACPDVVEWITRELRVCESVDRLFLPCREAGEELVRGDGRFRPVVARASMLMTGAAAPVRGGAQPRSHWGLPDEVPIGLFLGTAQPYRGLDLLLAAVRRLGRSDPAGVIAVAGCSADQIPFHPRLRALGPVSDVGDLLASVDVVVNVNRFSLFDLSTIEALEAGRPLLLTPVGGNLTFESLGAGCVMLESLEPAAIAGGMAAVFGLSRADLTAMGARSRACYEARLTPRHLRQRHVDLYDEVAATSGARA